MKFILLAFSVCLCFTDTFGLECETCGAYDTSCTGEKMKCLNGYECGTISGKLVDGRDVLFKGCISEQQCNSSVRVCQPLLQGFVDSLGGGGIVASCGARKCCSDGYCSFDTSDTFGLECETCGAYDTSCTGEKMKCLNGYECGTISGKLVDGRDVLFKGCISEQQCNSSVRVCQPLLQGFVDSLGGGGIVASCGARKCCSDGYCSFDTSGSSGLKCDTCGAFNKSCTGVVTDCIKPYDYKCGTVSGKMVGGKDVIFKGCASQQECSANEQTCKGLQQWFDTLSTTPGTVESCDATKCNDTPRVTLAALLLPIAAYTAYMQV